MFNFTKREKNELKTHRWIFGTMLAFGLIGLVASFVLAIEEFHLLKNPDATLSCSFSIVLNCSTVMKTWQASVFGFPNMFIGLMGYPIVITTAIVGLTMRKLPRLFWQVANVCYALGAIFAYWLFFNSLYAIEVLCPWCLIVTFSTTILLATITHYTLKENHFGLPDRVNARIQAILDKDIGKIITATWMVLLIALVFIKFGSALFA